MANVSWPAEDLLIGGQPACSTNEGKQRAGRVGVLRRDWKPDERHAPIYSLVWTVLVNQPREWHLLIWEFEGSSPSDSRGAGRIAFTEDPFDRVLRLLLQLWSVPS